MGLLINLDAKGAKIQLLDLPGIIEGAKDGKGRGKQVSCLPAPATSSIIESSTVIRQVGKGEDVSIFFR